MKSCPQCQKFYDDDDLQFCLEDGALLTFASTYQEPNRWSSEPKTVVQDRATNPNYQSAWTPQTGGPMQNWQGQGMNPQLQQFAAVSGQNQTMAIISLVLGCLSICCYIGWATGPIALILGMMHRKNIKANPSIYGGDGLALAGMLVGGILGGLWIIFIIFYIILFGAAALLGGH